MTQKTSISQFPNKGLGKASEVAQSHSSISISQWKYDLDILSKIGMTNSKPIDTPMDPNVKLLLEEVESFSNPRRYCRLVEKLNYLTIT